MSQQNIEDHVAMIDALADGRLKPGDRIHLVVCGHMTEDANFVGYDRATRKVTYRIGKNQDTLDWGDIGELWPVSLQDAAARAAAT